MIIAIDGPAASGKSTTALGVAQALGIRYLDTGAMYRAVTLAVIREKVDLNNVKSVDACLSHIELKLKFENSRTHVFLGDEDVTEVIRGIEVTRNVSAVSALPSVRRKLVSLQRKIALQGNTIVEGRDIGTVVFPDADFKFFIVADYETRGERRWNDLKKMGIDLSTEEIIKDLKRRDKIDSGRRHSPLTKAEDAVEIDTSGMTLEEQIGLIVETVKKEKKGGK